MQTIFAENRVSFLPRHLFDDYYFYIIKMLVQTVDVVIDVVQLKVSGNEAKYYIRLSALLNSKDSVIVPSK